MHDIRVAIKKIRSYLRLTAVVTGIAWKEKFEPLQQLFRALGRQRDTEMSLELLADYQQQHTVSLPLFRKLLSTKLRIAKQVSLQAATGFDEGNMRDLTQAIEQSLKNTDPETICSTANTLTAKHYKKAASLYVDFKKKAHAIRKRMKEVYYNQSVCPAETIDTKKLDQLLTALGHWQDYFIFGEQLKLFKKEFAVRHSLLAGTVKNCEQYFSKEKKKELKSAKHLFNQLNP